MGQYINIVKNSWYSGPVGFSFGLVGAVVGVVLVLLLIWSLIWKGLALWKSARDGSKVWFTVLLIVNTLGILEILYIYVFSKKRDTTHITPMQ